MPTNPALVWNFERNPLYYSEIPKLLFRVEANNIWWFWLFLDHNLGVKAQSFEESLWIMATQFPTSLCLKSILIIFLSLEVLEVGKIVGTRDGVKDLDVGVQQSFLSFGNDSLNREGIYYRVPFEFFFNFL